jgi:hypothetical protein
MDGKIALEEHWAIEETLSIAGQPVGAGAFWDATRRLLIDFYDRRLADMDAHGIRLEGLRKRDCDAGAAADWFRAVR